jgi:hypothetical protein
MLVLHLLSLRLSGGHGADWGVGGSVSSLGGQLVQFRGSSGLAFAARLPTLITILLGERASVSLGGPAHCKLLLAVLA